ncbi:MAG TPA: TlpA disulfide reductase family protein [Chloroflexota bacterium]|nr:TlpA disulfide reductase family protein [Chloroflexota bacterium]
MTDTMQIPESTPVAGKTSKGGIRWTAVAMWAVALGVLALLGWGLIQANAPRPEVGEVAPNFTVEFFTGYEWEGQPTVSLNDLEGKVVVLNFWASWCVECRYEADVLENASRQYAPDEVVFLGVAYADVEPNSLAYMEEFGVSYPHAPDLGTRISASYEITGVPETFVIGPDGKIVYVHIGPINQTTLNRVIAQAMEGGS